MFDVRKDDLSEEQTRALLALHLEGMHVNTPPGLVCALDLSGLRAPNVTVWTAWRNGRIAAMGALKMLTRDTAEVKSMRTHPDFLRMGAATRILETIIKAAKAQNIRRLSLETGTGPAFDGALALYRRYGFKEGPGFSDYESSDFNQFLHLDLDRESPFPAQSSQHGSS